jgi:hypothetical protein
MQNAWHLGTLHAVLLQSLVSSAPRQVSGTSTETVPPARGCLSRDPPERPTVEQLRAAWVRTLDLAKTSKQGEPRT